MGGITDGITGGRFFNEGQISSCSHAGNTGLFLSGSGRMVDIAVRLYLVERFMYFSAILGGYVLGRYRFWRDRFFGIPIFGVIGCKSKQFCLHHGVDAMTGFYFLPTGKNRNAWRGQVAKWHKCQMERDICLIVCTILPIIGSFASFLFLELLRWSPASRIGRHDGL